jgi:hypothetical protein
MRLHFVNAALVSVDHVAHGSEQVRLLEQA